MSKTAAKTNGVEKATDTATQENLPMFFKNPHPIMPERHASAGLTKNIGFGFAKNTNSVMLNIDDIAEAARSYPIIFTTDGTPRPLAVLGAGETNSFVDEAGQWDPMHYIPSYIRRYPFGLANLPDTEEMALCIDEDAPQYASESADIPFFDKGKPSQLTQDVLQFCGHFQKMNDETLAFGKAMKEADLLCFQNLDITSSDGKKSSFENLQFIHKDRWHNFAKTHANEWEQKNYLALVFMILGSQANWKYLVKRG